jgi:TP901 family phage tail tape measure protein
VADNRIEVEIVLDDGSIQKGFAKIESQAQKSGKVIESSFGSGFAGIAGRVASLVTKFRGFLALLGGLAGAISSALVFREFEKQLVAVGKTTDLAGENLARFGRRIDLLSNRIPLSTNKLLEFAEVAGQLGVTGSDNLEKFSETLARLGAATDVAGQEGARSLVRVLTITRTGVKNVDRFGSALVDLGNNFAATEGEILGVTTEIAKATAAFGLSSTEVLALGTSIKALGGQAESAGTAVGKTLRAIADAVAEGGSKLDNFNKVLGTTTEELRKELDTNAAGVFNRLIKNLNSANLSSTSLTKTLKSLGLTNERVIKNIAPLVKNYEVLASATERSNRAFQENRALNEESDKAFNTLDGSIIKFRSALTDLSKTLGSKVAPAFKTATDLATDFFNLLNEKLGGTELTPLEQQLKNVKGQIDELDMKLQNIGRGAGIGAFLDPEPLEAELLRLSKIYERLLAQQRGSIEAAEGEAGAIDGLNISAEESLKKRLTFQQRLSQATLSRINAELAALKRFDDAEIRGIERSILLTEKRKAIEEKFQLDVQALKQEFSNSEVVSQQQLNDLIVELERQKNVKIAELNRMAAMDGQVTSEQIKNATVSAFADMDVSANALGSTISSTFVTGFTQAFSSVGRALATGGNAFESFGKSVLSTLGGLAIQMGQFFILVGTGMTATTGLLGLSGGGAIAAGIGLQILGGILQGMGGGGAATGGAGAEGGGGAGFEEPDTSGLEELQDQSKIEVRIEGNVLDRRETGLEIVEILQEAFDTQQATVVGA